MAYVITIRVENEYDKWTIEELIDQTEEGDGFEDEVTVTAEEVEQCPGS